MFAIFWNLLKTDLYLFKKTIKDKFINCAIWVVATLIVTGYVLQSQGVSSSFGLFQAGSLIVSVSWFELYAQTFLFINDLEGVRHISYQLTLPIPSWLLYLKHATFFFINMMFLSLLVVPLVKLVLLNGVLFSEFNWPLLMISIFCSGLFFSFFTLFLTSIIPSMGHVENIMMRILFPMWHFGCFQFSWQSAYAISKALGFFVLLSPYTYATESVRSAMMGQAGFISPWICLPVLFLMTAIFGFWGYRNLKNRLDFV